MIVSYRKVVDDLKNNNSNMSREEKLKSSLPHLDGQEVPMFPQIEVKDDSYKWVWYIVTAVVLMLFAAFNYLFVVVKVDGRSMESTLTSGQFVLAKRHEEIKRFDIVVLSEREEEGGDEKAVIKRVIGLPGDTITVIDGNLYVNEYKYNETYIQKKNRVKFDNVDWTLKVPDESVFVMGDNRDISKESRLVGTFRLDAVKGVKVLGGKD